MITPTPAHAPVIPDSLLAKEATDILREHSTDLLLIIRCGSTCSRLSRVV